MLTRTLLTLGSIRTFSFSFLATVSGLRRTSGELAASISGTLCLSDVCEAKLDRERAAVREDRTHWRYGRRDWDCIPSQAVIFSTLEETDHGGDEKGFLGER